MMKQFALNSKSIYKILIAKGIDSFHHVNTVQTSITFIQNNALLSRKHVEDNQLLQTVQDSDRIDKEYNIWDDIFVDGLDLHSHFNRNSPYGPIMFKIELDILTLPGFQEVYITRDNPTFWKNKPNWEDRYYNDISAFEKDYRNSGKVRDGQIMFTFKGSSSAIRLNKFCKEIIIDDPQIFSYDKTKSLGHITLNRINNELRSNSLSHIPLTIRHSGNIIPLCWCVTNYNQMRTFNKSKFVLFFK